VAESVGVDVSTIYRWRQQREFQRVLHGMKRHLLDQTALALELAGHKALETLERLHTDESMPPGIRCKAALSLLERSQDAQQRAAFPFTSLDEVAAREREFLQGLPP
jgi:hypothetical protein